jgi:hypothetical protein
MQDKSGLTPPRLSSLEPDSVTGNQNSSQNIVNHSILMACDSLARFILYVASLTKTKNRETYLC